MASLISWGRKKVQQAVAQVNPLDNNRTWKNLQGNAPQQAARGQAPPSAFQQLTRQAQHVGTGVGLGGVRSLTGAVQGVSGLVDLASPGYGTNRVSKSLDRFAKFTDATAKAEGVSTPIYRGGQLGTDALTFITGAGLVKAAAKAPAAVKFLQPINRVTTPVGRTINTSTAKLATKGPTGRVAAATVRGLTNPANNAANLITTAKLTGEDASKGRDINAKGVGTNLAVGTAFNAGIPLAGALTKESGRAAMAGGRKALPVVKSAGQQASLTPAPIRQSKAELRTLSDYADYRMGQYKPNSKTANQLIVDARRIAKKQGVDVTSGSPRDIQMRIATKLEELDQQGKGISQGGYARLPVGKGQPQVPRNTQSSSQTSKLPDVSASSKPSILPQAETVLAAPRVEPTKTTPRINALPVKSQPQGAAQIPNVPPVASMPSPRGKETRFASKSIPESAYVSQKVKGSIKAPLYDPNTERQAYTSSLARLKSEGNDTFETQVRSALDKKNGTISRQEAVDATTLAQLLDAQGEAGARKATEIYEKLSEHYTAGGQLVQAAAILSRRTPDGLRMYATRQLKKAGVKITPELNDELTAAIQAVKQSKPGLENDLARNNVLKLLDNHIPTTVGDKVINLWRAGLLTAPTTTLGNIVGNTGEAAVRKLWTNPVATVADMAMGAVTGKRTQTLAGGFSTGAKVGTTKLPTFMRTGYDERNALSKYDSREMGGVVGKLTNPVYRLMSVADQPYWYGARQEALQSIAKAEGLNKGLSGADLNRFVSSFIKNPPEAALDRAANEARYATFQNKTALGGAATGLKRGARNVSPTAGSIADFFIPFTQVPASIATRIAERTPVGTAHEVVKQFLNVKKGGQFDQRAMAQAIGNGSFAPAVFGAGYALAKNGQLTFGYPKDEKERKLFEKEGKQPYSVRIGNRWYSLNYLQPFGTLLAIGGQANDAIKAGKNAQEVLSEGLATAGQSVMNQSFLKGIGGALDAISDPERSAKKYVEQTTSSVVPNFIRSFARANDPLQRDPTGVVEGVKSGIPGVRQSLPTKDDMFGEPLPAKDNVANQYLNPFRPSIARDDPVTAELRRLFESDNGVTPTDYDKRAFGKSVNLTPAQTQELNRNVGPELKKAYEGIINDPRYRDLSDEDKVKALRRANDTVGGAKKVAFGVERDIIPPDPKKLDTKQKRYLQGQKVDLLTDSKISKTPLEEYQAALEDYNKNKNSYTPVQRLKADRKLQSLAVGKDFERDIIDLYSLGKAQVYNFISSSQNGNQLVDQLVAYGDALEKATGTRNKFRLKNGAVSIAPSTGGSRSRKGRLVTPKVAKSPKIKTPKIKTKVAKAKMKTPKRVAYKPAKIAKVA